MAQLRGTLSCTCPDSLGLAASDCPTRRHDAVVGDDVESCPCGEYRAPCPWDGPGNCDTAASFGILD
jgi:hypothetical protein